MSDSFTAVGAGTPMTVAVGDSFHYDVSGTFDGTVILEQSIGRSAWIPLGISLTTTDAKDVQVQGTPGTQVQVRFRCTVYNSGTIVCVLTDVAMASQTFTDSAGLVVLSVVDGGVKMPAVVDLTGATVVRTLQKILIPASGVGKAGATAGFAPVAGDDIAVASCPASKTGATLVVPVTGLKRGQTITGFYLVGRINSAGNAVTVDADLRKQTAAATGITDASVGAIAQVAVTAQTKLDDSSAGKTGLSESVAADKSYYVLVTATTGASTGVDIAAVVLIVTEA